MFARKVYSEEKVSRCPFCNASATVRNNQKVPVCMRHKDMILDDMKCSCGKFLEVKQGKFGPFFVCVSCGILNFKKGLEINGYPLKSVEDI